MFWKTLVMLILGALLSFACAGQQPVTPSQEPEDTPTQPTKITPVPPTATPPSEVVTPTSPSYPPPDEGSPAPWEPQPGDELLTRGEIFIDVSEILILESFPPQFVLRLAGSLPTPCHQLRVELPAPDEQNRILVGAYSLVDASKICLDVLAPFEVNIPLGSFPAGTYPVFVNGQLVGEIVSPETGFGEVPPPYPDPVSWEPQEGDEKLERASVGIETNEIIVLESFPPQFVLHLAGWLPTPCNQLRATISSPDEQNRIPVEVYSLVDPNQACILVIKQFEINLPLGSFAEGRFTVWVNGEQVGEIAP